jgi:hypothetical protein
VRKISIGIVEWPKAALSQESKATGVDLQAHGQPLDRPPHRR